MKKNRSKSKKVAVIGAGIVGLYLARKLSEKGHKVEVFEKRNKVGKEVCSGFFSDRILDYFPESSKLTEREADSVKVRFPKKTVEVVFSRKFLLMDHAKLDEMALLLAKKSGAKIIFNSSFLPDPDDFDSVIGCDGALSEVRRVLEVESPDFWLGAQKYLPLEEGSDIEVWPAKKGFSWKIPRKGRTELGAAVPFDSTDSIKHSRYKNFALIPQGLRFPENEKITLCGDAAGLCKPWSGGGVIWGLKAADMLLKNFPDFSRYQKKVRMFFVPRIFFGRLGLKTALFLGFKIPKIIPSKIKTEGDFLL